MGFHDDYIKDKERIREDFVIGRRRGFEYMLVYKDLSGCYLVEYVWSRFLAEKLIWEELKWGIVEVYDLNMDLDSQLNEKRSYHI